MKHEWRKQEKGLYLPKNKPEVVDVPELNFLTIDGIGNPNEELFAEYIGVLYSAAYAVRMSPKQGIEPEGYFEYTVYPLEGIWGLTDEGITAYDGIIDKNELKYTLMIRQPDFVTDDFAADMIERTKKKKPHRLLDELRFEKITEGKCIQMMHLGPYDDEPESFSLMEDFCVDAGLERAAKTHREIYITDARKTDPTKLKTVIRFQTDDD